MHIRGRLRRREELTQSDLAYLRAVLLVARHPDKERLRHAAPYSAMAKYMRERAREQFEKKHLRKQNIAGANVCTEGQGSNGAKT
jgi:hypothetical protein